MAAPAGHGPGLRYEIAAKAAAEGRTDRGILKAAANSAIRHGPC